MPIYQYVCLACEHKFEELLKMKDRKKPCKSGCPSCKAKGKVQQTAWGNSYGVGVDSRHDPLVTSNLDSCFRDKMKKIASEAPRFDGVRTRLKDRFG